MEINLFFDRNREIQKSLSFIEGNGFSHSLSYYLDYAKQNITINNYFFVSKINRTFANSYMIKIMLNKKTGFKGSYTFEWFKTINDKLYTNNNKIFAYNNNYKKSISLYDNHVFAIKDIELFINNTDPFYHLQDKKNMPLFDIIQIKTKSDSKIKTKILDNLMLDFRIKEITNQENDIRINIHDSKIDVYNFEKRLKSYNKEIYLIQDMHNIGAGAPAKEIEIQNFESVGVSNNNVIIEYNKIFAQSNNKLINNISKNCRWINNYRKNVIVNNKFQKEFSKYNKHISFNELQKFLSKYFKSINYKDDFKCFSKIEHDILVRNENTQFNVAAKKTNKEYSFLHIYRNNIYSLNELQKSKTFIVKNKNISINDNIFTANKCSYDLLKYNAGILNISKSPKAIFEIDNIISFYKNGKGIVLNKIIEIGFGNKNRKQGYLEYYNLQFSKERKNTKLEYDILGYNKSLKHSQIDDIILNISKYKKGLMEKYKPIWCGKNPKSIFKEKYILFADKFSKDISINNNYINVDLYPKDMLINKYSEHVNLNSKILNNKSDGVMLFKLPTEINKNKFVFLDRKIYNVYYKQPVNFFSRTKNSIFSTNQKTATMDKRYLGINEDVYTLSRDKREARLNYDFVTATAIHYDGEEKPELGSGKIDELILPHNDFDYNKYLSKLINDDGSINMKYVKKYNSSTETYTVTIPVENPINVYKNMGRDYADVDTNTLEILSYIIKKIWKDKMFKYAAMSAKDSLKDMIITANNYIDNNYNLDKKRRYEFDRAIQLFRWYSEMAILNNCEYELKFDTKSEKVNYLSRDLGTLNDMIELKNMHISKNLILEPINNMKYASVKFINNKKNILSSPILSFTLYNVNTKSSISITDRDNLVSTNIYEPGMYEIESKLENEYKIEFNPTSNDQNIAIAKIKISNIQIPSFTVTYKGVFGEINPIMKELLKQSLIFGDVPQNVKDSLGDVMPVTSAISRFQQYFEIHHRDKDKGKRLITKK